MINASCSRSDISPVSRLQWSLQCCSDAAPPDRGSRQTEETTNTNTATVWVEVNGKGVVGVVAVVEVNSTGVVGVGVGGGGERYGIGWCWGRWWK